MKKDTIDQLFDQHKDEFDVEVPNLGHQERFLAKLNSADADVTQTKSGLFKLWKPVMAVAATIVLCFSLITILHEPDKANDLASVSPEMAKTQDFFTSTITNELNKLNKERTPETKALIDDALKQMEILEKNYESLKKDLAESGDDKRVIYAMISNFQNRIDVLQNVMERIEDVKQIKQMTL